MGGKNSVKAQKRVPVEILQKSLNKNLTETLFAEFFDFMAREVKRAVRKVKRGLWEILALHYGEKKR